MKFNLQRFAGETPIETTKSYTLADSSTVTVTATNNGVEFNEGMGALTQAIKAKITASSGGGASSENANVTNSKELIKHFTYEIISGATITSTSDLDCFTIINIDGNRSYNNEIYIKLSMDNTNYVFDISRVYGIAFIIGTSTEVSFHENTNYSGNEKYYSLSIDNSSATCYIKIIQDNVSLHELKIYCLLSPQRSLNGADPPDCYHLVMLNIRLDGE